MNAPLLVTAAIIRKGSDANASGEFLIARRKFDAKAGAGLWEFPGGKVEFGEHPEACLVREIREELNLEVAIDRFFDIASHVYSGGPHVILLCYICRVIGGELALLEVADSAWIRTEDLASFDFAPADLPLVERLARLGI
jgi:8-oxo-dGTP diphosphatase